MQRLGGFGGVADTLDAYNQYTGDPGFLPKDVAMTEAVTAKSVQAAAVKYLDKDSAVVVYCVPGKKVLDDVPRSPADTDANVKLVNPYTAGFRERRRIGGRPSLKRVLRRQFICQRRKSSRWKTG